MNKRRNWNKLIWQPTKRKGMIDMCQAVDEALQECKAQGLKEGIVGVKEDERRKVIVKLMKKFNINQEEAMDILDILLSEQNKYRIFANI